jgi:hypothetical protein
MIQTMQKCPLLHVRGSSLWLSRVGMDSLLLEEKKMCAQMTSIYIPFSSLESVARQRRRWPRNQACRHQDKYIICNTLFGRASVCDEWSGASEKELERGTFRFRVERIYAYSLGRTRAAYLVQLRLSAFGFRLPLSPDDAFPFGNRTHKRDVTAGRAPWRVELRLHARRPQRPGWLVLGPGRHPSGDCAAAVCASGQEERMQKNMRAYCILLSAHRRGPCVVCCCSGREKGSFSRHGARGGRRRTYVLHSWLVCLRLRRRGGRGRGTGSAAGRRLRGPLWWCPCNAASSTDRHRHILKVSNGQQPNSPW